MEGRYVSINCLYVKEPIQVWVICNTDTPIDELKDRARHILLQEMTRQLKEGMEGRSISETVY
jgi:hypothetical protein